MQTVNACVEQKRFMHLQSFQCQEHALKLMQPFSQQSSPHRRCDQARPPAQSKAPSGRPWPTPSCLPSSASPLPAALAPCLKFVHRKKSESINEGFGFMERTGKAGAALELDDPQVLQALTTPPTHPSTHSRAGGVQQWHTAGAQAPAALALKADRASWPALLDPRCAPPTWSCVVGRSGGPYGAGSRPHSGRCTAAVCGRI